jgi:perosamine synthetase
VKHAVAVNSGTAALHLGALGLKLGPGDEVLVPSYTFAASVNAILYTGARPVFVDIEPTTFNLDPNDLERKRTPRTRAVVTVDIFGHPVAWDAVLEFASVYQLPILDDACEGLGAEYKGRRLGGFGNASAFGFYPNKQITTGEGGALVTNDDEIARQARAMRNQGREEMGTRLHHERLGFNYRLNELSAALGVSQLKRVDEILSRREGVTQQYDERLSNVAGIQLPGVSPDVKKSWFVYVIALGEEFDRDQIMRALAADGIPSREYFSAVHSQPYMQSYVDASKIQLPVTENIQRRTLALPFYGGLAEADIDRVATSVSTALEAARSQRA